MARLTIKGCTLPCNIDRVEFIILSFESSLCANLVSKYDRKLPKDKRVLVFQNRLERF